MSNWQRQDFSGRRALLGLPVTIAIAASLLHLVPTKIIDVFTIWLLVSLPIGVLIGHCILDQE